ncbi:head decoration protein [Thiocapsa sp.]|uniref:head decoration protein n=1 Tax=Thiocapsa sp. TaxID=2024551 RepID=UPI0025F1DEC4|nr:head decoration protein [Thiocapsa sp.]
MTVYAEGPYAGEFLVASTNESLSLDVGTLAAGQNLTAGTVIGIASDGTLKQIARRALAGTSSKVEGDGNGTVGAATLGADALVGDYILTCTAEAADAGTFSVVAPDGTVLDPLTVGEAYVSTHINLTISDGATDWGEGAVCKVAVAEASGALANEQIAVGVLLDNVDASAAAKKAVYVARLREVNGYGLTWPVLMTTTNKAEALTALASRFIVVR